MNAIDLDLLDPRLRSTDADLLEAELLLQLEAEAYYAAQNDLATYTRLAWPELEPGRDLVWNWHMDAICDHLTAVSYGQITNLLISICPRTLKSTLCGVAWPTWTWAQPLTPGTLRGPHVRFLTGSHSDGLAKRDALRSRRVMESTWYRGGYGHFEFTSDQNTKGRYENDKLGSRLTFGVKTGVTGEGGDILMVDDPHVAVEGMYSKAERETVLDTWDQQIANRVNDPKNSARVIIMQRLHVSDLIGHVKEQMKCEILELPTEYDRKYHRVTGLGWTDPREEDGKLLFPQRMTQEWVDAERKRLGAYGFAAQHGQRPVPFGGKIINVEAIGRFSHKAKYSYVFIGTFWDTAQKAADLNNPWAGGAIGYTEDGKIHILEVVRKRMGYPEGKQRVFDFHAKWQGAAIVVEDKSSGSSLVQEGQQVGLPMVPFQPEGDKVMRAAVESPTVEAGQVLVPDEGPWVGDFLAECAGFPDHETADQVDMFSMALRYIRENIAHGLRGIEPISVEKESDFYTEDSYDGY